jgi:hypothetical protein
MWTWKFELNDILTTLTIVSIVAGLTYKVLVLPLLEKRDLQHLQDTLIFQEKMGVLTETLNDLKNEIKLSREERVKAFTEHVKLATKVNGMESQLNELKGDLHEHTAKAH